VRVLDVYDPAGKHPSLVSSPIIYIVGSIVMTFSNQVITELLNDDPRAAVRRY
jgi:hypothetical protein